MFHSLCVLEISEKCLQSVSLNNANVLLLRKEILFSTVIEDEFNKKISELKDAEFWLSHKERTSSQSRSKAYESLYHSIY